MREITPKHLKCWPAHCPALWEEGEDFILIGKIEENFEHQYRVGPWEQVVRIPKAFFAKAEIVSGPPDHLADFRTPAVEHCVREDIIS